MGGTVSSPAVDEHVRSSILQLEEDVADQQQQLGFQVRTYESMQLVKVLAGEPSRVTLLIGPKESGKSNLLLQLQQNWPRREVRQIFAPFLLVNLHECLITDLKDDCYNYSAAEGLYIAMRSEIKNWLEMAKATLQNSSKEDIAGMPITSISASLESFSHSFQRGGHNLISLLSLLQVSLKQNSHVRPIIILDEAHQLKPWCRFTKLLDEVGKLAQFFLWLCKDKARGHVVMATSTPFFWSWLAETLQITALKMMPVGYFSENDAMRFVVDYLIPRHPELLPSGGFKEDVWKSMYEVTGGCPHLLKIVVDDATECGSWTDAIESMVSIAGHELREKILEITDREYWNFAHVEGIVGGIVAGRGLVGFDEAMTSMFPGEESKGRSLVKKLAEENIIHVRLWTSGMKYMDVGEKRGDETLYLMALNPSYFAAMKQLYPAWFASAKKQDEKSSRRDRRKRSDSGGDDLQGGSEGDLGASGGEWDYE